MITINAAQAQALVTLRAKHPRAEVRVVDRHDRRDPRFIRVKLRWPSTTFVRWVWIDTEGELSLTTPEAPAPSPYFANGLYVPAAAS